MWVFFCLLDPYCFLIFYNVYISNSFLSKLCNNWITYGFGSWGQNVGSSLRFLTLCNAQCTGNLIFWFSFSPSVLFPEKQHQKEDDSEVEDEEEEDNDISESEEESDEDEPPKKRCVFITN